MNKPFKIGIIGAGFTGTAMAAILQRLTTCPLEVILCEKTGRFGAGPAYSTPYSHHLLNVRVQDMSAFADEPTHFLAWLNSHPDHLLHMDKNKPLEQQFAPRRLYHDYLQSLLSTLQSHQNEKFRIRFESIEVTDIDLAHDQATLIFSDQQKVTVDKVILAIGNNPPAHFPFAIADDIHRIDNPWDYQAIKHIGKNDPVLIVGTGLSMIDAVLTLHHQQHQGDIHVVSRHGLLPLPHTDRNETHHLNETLLYQAIPELTKHLRFVCQKRMQEGGDWRSVLNAFRHYIPLVWKSASMQDKKRFLRHLLPYWNIHRHRVHGDIMGLLTRLIHQGQLRLLSGRIATVGQGKAAIKLRQGQIINISTQWIVNCMGPIHQMSMNQQPLIKALCERKAAAFDSLQIGLAIDDHCALTNSTGESSTLLYALGAPTKGATWEMNAVPEIRQQILSLARHLLAIPSNSWIM